MSMIGNFIALSPEKLSALISDPSGLAELFYPENEEDTPSNYLDIEKAWHGIHFLLTGEAWGGDGPLAQAVLGGIEIGEDMGYGPARYLTPEEVRAVARSLAAISTEQLKKRYSSDALEAAEIYPTGIWEAEGWGAFDYLVQNFEPLVHFYHEAAERGDAVILYLN